MKKIIYSLSLLFLCSFGAKAVPAYPGPVQMRDVNGSPVTVYLHGDEYLHWASDSRGTVYSINAQGLLVRGGITKADISYNKYIAREERRKDFPEGIVRSSMTEGNNHFLILLIEYADLPFKVENPNKVFSDLLNLPGYSENGGTGSVHDYYFDQSKGRFDPVFDVIGPIKVSGNMSDYGGNDPSTDFDKAPEKLVYEACMIADTLGVDFSRYDLDSDGFVDNIFFFYAGYSEAEGGGAATIWPHASFLYGKYQGPIDGVRLGRYACASELKGVSGTRMSGIGTFCHEFGHVLGLPDFYDTNYETDGQSDGLMTFSLMSGGSYNNNGRTPPNLNAVERNMLGWMGLPADWTEDGTITISPITDNVAYVTPTSTEGEYFLYEVRDGSGWDAHIGNPAPQGMLVYHIDRSMRLVDGISASQRWENWDGINDYASHPCFRIISADSNPDYYADMVFPGRSNITAMSESSRHTKSWDGGYTGYDISGISYSGGKVTATLTKNRNRKIFGTVSDSDGKPMEGVKITLTDKNAPETASRRFAPGKLRSSRQVMLASAIGGAATGKDGKFSLEIPASASDGIKVEFFKNRYQPQTLEFELKAGSMAKDVVLLNAGEGPKSDLQKYKYPGTYGLGYGGVPASVTVGVRFTADELAPYAGMKVSEIKFLFYGESADEVSVFLDYGDRRFYTRRVANPNFAYKMSSQDISDANIIIPKGTDIIFGYALRNVDDEYPMALAGDEDAEEGSSVCRPDAEPKGGGWDPLSTEDYAYNAVISVTLQQIVSPFDAFGIKIIPNAGSYKVGSEYRFEFENGTYGDVPESTEWYFDGAPQTSKIILLPAGKHEVKAVNTYSDGRREEIIQMINVN